MLFLCQPNNPTGQLADKGTVDRLLDICRQYDVWLVLDACFVELLETPEMQIQKQVIADCLQYAKTLVIKAFTKSFGMAGLRLGYLIGNDRECLNQMREALQPWNVSLPAQYAGLAALSEQMFLKKSRDYVQAEKAWLLAELQDCQVISKIYGHAANYIFFKAKENLKEALLEEKIMIRDCSNYQGLSKGYYRIAVRTHMENERLIEALKRQQTSRETKQDE
jgi:threonine-phosphate decarboxylase